MQFVTDESGVDHGFYGLVEAIPEGIKPTRNDSCPQGQYRSTFGALTSPNWPEQYPNDASCDYLIEPPNGAVQLVFVAFETESCCDFVEIYDGGDKSAPMLAKLSGKDWVDAVFNSSNSQLLVHFESDRTNVFAGFSAYYQLR